MPSRQINDFSQKGNRKKIELVARPAQLLKGLVETVLVLTLKNITNSYHQKKRHPRTAALALIKVETKKKE